MIKGLLGRLVNNPALKYRYTILFVTCLVLFLGVACLEEVSQSPLPTDIFSYVLLLASLVVLSRSAKLCLAAAILASISIVSLCLGNYFSTYWLDFIETISEICLYSMVLYIIIVQLLQDREIILDHIFGAVAGYFLIGFCWYEIYSFLELIYTTPAIIADGRAATESELLYYSFSTLTTLGYGDVLPTGIFLRHVTILEAIAGQLYIAVLMARLVGLNLHYIVNRKKS